MTDKIRVSKWFDEWFRDESDAWSKNEIIGMIGACQLFRSFYDYKRAYSHFDKEQYQEIRDNFEDYVRAILDGDYEVEVEEKTPLGWIPEEGERYWLVQNVGAVAYNIYENHYDKNLVKYTKVFKTQEEAEFEAEKMKVTRELEKYACGYIKEKENYCLTAHYNNRELWTISIDFDIFQGYVFKRYGLYFESEERAQEAIKAVGEDRVLKYYFGVENE